VLSIKFSGCIFTSHFLGVHLHPLHYINSIRIILIHKINKTTHGFIITHAVGSSTVSIKYKRTYMYARRWMLRHSIYYLKYNIYNSHSSSTNAKKYFSASLSGNLPTGNRSADTWYDWSSRWIWCFVAACDCQEIECHKRDARSVLENWILKRIIDSYWRQSIVAVASILAFS